MLQIIQRVFVVVLLATAWLCIGPAQTKPDATKSPARKAARIDLNRARLEELKALPGIDDAAAKKIVDGRPYRNAEQMVSKGILSKAAYDRIKELVSAGPTNPWRP
jgi:DNA uptake protein ComE-like DNA-binding protein